MPRPLATEEDRQIESWEITIPGTVYINKYDRRDDKWHKTKVGGRSGSRILRISRDDRRYNQEQIPLENSHLDPFTNGTLRLVEAATQDQELDVRYHFTDEELAEMFEVRDEQLFADALEDIKSELILRRLQAMGEKRATLSQSTAIRALLERRYPISKAQKTIREMDEAGGEKGLDYF